MPTPVSPSPVSPSPGPSTPVSPPTPGSLPPSSSSLRDVLRTDLTASLTVFLVALPLCVGVALASGVPAELGLVTGIVGGLVAGALPGSNFLVSGPAAGLTVLVYEAVNVFGLPILGVLVFATGLLQILLGALRLGRWFRAISVSVVEGMLAGIGLVLIAGQLYAMVDEAAPRSGPGKLVGLPELVLSALGSAEALTAATLGVGTIVVMELWRRAPRPATLLPAPLAAVALATMVSLVLDLPVARVEVHGLLDAIQPPGADEFRHLADPGVIGTVVAFALIASAESLFSAAAVDRMHAGSRTAYDKELLAQGAGNAVCGVLGALPMTAVIVRSAANVQAGARTKAARILHGGWLLLFAALLPAALGVIPLAALAGVLIHCGWKLIPVRELRQRWHEHRGETVVFAVTALAIVTTTMFEGVLLGVVLAVAKAAWEASHIRVDVDDQDETLVVRLTGHATFLRLPTLLDTLEALPTDRPVKLDLRGLRHLDHACHTALTAWAARHNHRIVPSADVHG